MTKQCHPDPGSSEKCEDNPPSCHDDMMEGCTRRFGGGAAAAGVWAGADSSLVLARVRSRGLPAPVAAQVTAALVSQTWLCVARPDVQTAREDMLV